MPEKKSRRFFILTASIGTGHSQAARAIAESIKEMHPEAVSYTHLTLPTT